MNERLLIVGGSVRAAAMSARRAGFEPIAIDRFGDADLQRVCGEFQRLDQLCRFPALARQMSFADWIYTGPLENYPVWIEQLAEQRKLLGNGRATLGQLRDPWRLAGEFAEAGLRSPALSAAGQFPAGRGWLRKPLQAGGGFGVERVELARTSRRDGGDSMYFQKFIAGRSVGATFLGARGRAVLVGVAEQLLGTDWGGSREFQYVGSCGPIVMFPEQIQALQRIGDCIAQSCAVQGLFGVDAIINDEGVWPVEVNPRYAASVEIIERALDIATIRWHIAACRRGELPNFSCENAREGLFERHGKAIVYADREVAIDARFEGELFERNAVSADPMVADIPVAGTNIPAGDPIVTVFAKGKTCADVQHNLRTAMAEVRRLARAV